ncbi:MAG: hypothetical protein ACFCVK_00575 [Acidimicrobiales bacterium]
MLTSFLSVQLAVAMSIRWSSVWPLSAAAPDCEARQTKLRHGVFLAPFHSVRENPTLTPERDLELWRISTVGLLLAEAVDGSSSPDSLTRPGADTLGLPRLRRDGYAR